MINIKLKTLYGVTSSDTDHLSIISLTADISNISYGMVEITQTFYKKKNTVTFSKCATNRCSRYNLWLMVLCRKFTRQKCTVGKYVNEFSVI